MLESETGRDFASAASGRTRIVQPCSSEQARFWFEEQLQPRNPARNVFARWRLEGEVARADIERAWRMLIERHDALRTSLDEVDGVPVQIIEPRVDFQVREIDLTLLGEAEAAAEAERIAAVEAQTPFSLSVAPLVRVTHVRQRQGASILMMTAHHSVCDGWSVGILAREMGEICAALHEGRVPALPSLPLTYHEYSARQRREAGSAVGERDKAQLRRLLSGYRQFELLPDRKRPEVQTWRGDIASVLLEREVTAALAELARREGCTLFTAAYASLVTLLHRHSGETDIALGTQVAGRDDVDLEPVVGTFVNTVVLRTDVGDDPAFLDLLRRARETVVDAFEVRHVPIDTVVELLRPKRDRSRNPLLSVNFVYQRSFVENAGYGSFSLVDLPSRSAGALYDLCFFMVERPEGWRISCEYNVDLFETATVTRLVERFAGLLRDVSAYPERRLSALPVLSEADRAELAALNRTEAAYPSERTVHELFGEQAARTPRATAVTCAGTSLTYGDLDAAANRLARELQARGLAPGAFAGVFLPRSLDFVVALLAVLKCGAAFLALDPERDDPQETIEDVRTAPALWITGLSAAHALGTSDAPLLFIDADGASIEARESTPPEAPAGASSPAFVSGCAGAEPIVISHRSLLNVVCSMGRRLALRSRESLLAVSAVSSDCAALDVFLPLLTGAELVLATQPEIGDGDRLDQLLERSGATVMQAGAATWQRLVDSRWPGNRALRALCAEALPPALAERLAQRTDEVWCLQPMPGTAICSFVRALVPGDDDCPVVTPLDNTRAYIVDRFGNLVPPGTPGELYIGGDGVALGPLQASETAEARFAPDHFEPAPGARLSRTGRLARSRSSGIELLAQPDAPVPVESAAPEPAATQVVDAAVAVAAAPALTPTEWELRGSVAALLGHDAFGCDDDIFSLGFHSLLALRLIARVKQSYGVDLSLRAVVEHPTIAAMSAEIDALRSTLVAAEPLQPVTPLNAGGKRTPLFFLHSDLFAEGLYAHRLATTLGPDQPLYSVAPHGTAGLKLLRSVEEMARDYLPRVRALQPSGPYRVGGFCASGLVAYELARLLEAEGESVERVVLINASPMPARTIAPLDLVMRLAGLNRRLGPQIRTTICYNLARVHAALVRGPRSTAEVLFERLAALARRGTNSAARVADPQPFEKRRGEERTENSFGHVVAAFTYHPKPFQGTVTLIWGMAQHISPDLPRRDWEGVAKNVRLIPMAGGHVEQLSERVDDLARAIETALS
jgi:non-ribosomal peptide synthetase component F/thioesterase domain-containing protein/aryl carrier-like protein